MLKKLNQNNKYSKEGFRIPTQRNNLNLLKPILKKISYKNRRVLLSLSFFQKLKISNSKIIIFINIYLKIVILTIKINSKMKKLLMKIF